MKRRRIGAALAAAAVMLAGAAAAQAGTSEIQSRYRSERAACMNGSSNQDRATCLKEAGAARREALRGNQGTPDATLAENRLMRCQGLPAPDREDCRQRMMNGTTSGSAAQGGVLREVETPATPRR